MGPFNLSYSVNFTASTNTTLDLTHDNVMIPFQHIMDISSLTKCFDIKIALILYNQNYYKAQVATSCTDLTVYKIGFSRIIYDKTAI